jgi:hypothetical protein
MESVSVSEEDAQESPNQTTEINNVTTTSAAQPQV